MKEAFLGTFPIKEIESAIDVDAIIIGIPYEDGLKIYPEGSKLAPKIIRKVSNYFSGQSFTRQCIHNKNVLDFGNINSRGNFEQVMDLISENVSNVLNKKAIPILIGGDHSIAYGTAKGISHSKEKFDGIVWIDAHLDLMDSYPEKKKFTRATILRRIYELELFENEDIYLIGSRGHNLGLEEVKFVEKNKLRILEASKIRNYSIFDDFIQEINGKNLYISLDIDVLDPAFAPGVGVPEPGGLSTRELFYIIEKLASRTKCFEIVEVNPNLDLNNITSMIACKVIFKLLDFI
ncbi:MAG: arginase family protein [Asgard group archaeon]|nr:arginase family protein [Asgard group archaeon]